jgi:CspA family cold shock protein
MEKGTIRWFDNKKGYGFIEKESDGKDLFVHYSAIDMEGYKTLKAKEEVEFEVVDGEKGEQAAEVKRAGTLVAEEEVSAEETDE